MFKPIKNLFILAVAGITLAGSANAAQDAWNPLPVGSKAPNFTVIAPSGKTVKLSDFKGKVVLVDFWATWCGPCQASMPGLEKIYGQIKNKGVVVLSINTWDEDAEYKKWLKVHSGKDYHFNFVRDPAKGDPAAMRAASIAKKDFKVIGIPTMYVIDRDGKIAGSILGSGEEATLVSTLEKVGVKATVPK